MKKKFDLKVNDVAPLLSDLKLNELTEIQIGFLLETTGRENIQSIKKKDGILLNKTIIDFICKKLDDEEQIKCFHLDLRNQSKENLMKLNESIKKNNSLKELSLSIDGESMKIIFEAIESNKSLENLNIMNLDDNYAASLLSRALESNDTLKTLQFFAMNNISSNVLYQFLEKNKSINYLDFPFSLNRNDFPDIFDKLKYNNTLTQLSLRENIFDNQVTLLLCDYFKFNLNLEIIELSYNYLETEQITLILQSLKCNQKLSEFIFCGQNFGEKDLEYLCKSILTKTCLKVLNISSNKISDEGMKVFCDFLQSNKSVEELDLSENNIADFGLECLSNYLLSNISLKSLNLSHNKRIGQKGIKFLSKSLQKNRKLENLNLCNSNLKDKKLEYLSEMLMFNRNIKFLNIKHNNFGQHGISSLCEALKINSTIEDLFFREFFKKNKDYSQHYLLYIDALKVNNSISKTDMNDQHSYVKYLINCNKQWTIKKHKNSSINFKNGVFVFILCLKLIEKNLQFKLGKFIVFEMIKRINRKAYFDLDFPKVLKEQDTFIDRKRKRDGIEDVY